MAYSANIRQLIIGLCKSRSPEDVSSLLEIKIADKEHGCEFISSIAGSMQITFNRADWENIEQSVPSAKTIRIWLSDKSLPDRSLQDRSQSIGHFDMEKHRYDLLTPVISQLRDISVFPARDFDLAIFWSRPSEPSWPIGGGYVGRQTRGRLGSCLFVEEKLEWDYLHQHLIDDPIWDAIDKWKQAMVMDFTARFGLLDKIVAEIQSKIGLPVLDDLARSGNDKDGLGLYYAYTIYDQVFPRAVGIRLVQKHKEDFTFEPPNVTHLGGYMAVRSRDLHLHTLAIDYLLDAQVSLAELPETRTVRAAYKSALSKTALVKKHSERIRLAVAFPAGSKCDGCSQLVTTFE